MKTKALKIINLIVAVLVSVFALGHAFAWLVGNRLESLQDFNGSSGSPYFASGTGAQNDPFIITNQYHMYNLAWLQNTGKFDKQYYFQVGNDISIPENFWLPPIGTDTNPFEGVFNGKGYKITNLQVTTDNSKLTGVVSGASVKYSNAVGMFGMTDAGADISNFILEKPVVEVANANATYSTTANKVAGLAVGHVAQDSKVYSIGVLADQTGTKLLMNKGGYSTFNSIIGELAEGVESSVTGGGHTSGGTGSNFGASFDVDGMLDRLRLILANKKESPYLPTLDTSSDNPVVGSGDLMPFAVTEESTYTGAAAREITANNNIGYFLGNQNKISTTKELKFTDPLTQPLSADGQPDNTKDWYATVDGINQSPAKSGRVPKWVYKFDGGYSLSADVYTSQMGFAPLSQSEFDELPETIKNIFPEDNDTKVRFTGVKLSQAWWINDGQVVQPYMSTGDGNGNWSFHGQIVWNGKTYGEGFRDHEGYVVDENWQRISYVNDWGGTNYYKFNEYTEGVILPNCSIWFKPAQSGKIKLLMFTDGGLEGFALLRIVREGADASNPFKVNAELINWQWQTDIYVTQVMRVRLPKNVLFYYEHEVTAEDIANGNVEYMLVSENGGAYFVYMDIGASGSSGDTGEVDHEKAVSAVDFIYSDVSIAQKDDTAATPAYHMGDFIVGSSLYETTGTSIYFDKLDTILEIIFLRKAVNEEQTMQVTVTGTTDDTKVTATNTNKVEFVFNA